MKKFDKMSQKDSCLFSSLGWIEADQSVSVAGLTEDLSKFPAMNSSFSFAEMKKCSKDLAKSWSSRAKRRRCDAKYSGQERARVGRRELVVAGMKCLKNMMRQTCRDFLRSTSASLVELPDSPNIALPLPANIGPAGGAGEGQGSKESSEESSEELIISSFPGSGPGHFPGHHKPFPIPDHIAPFPVPGLRPPPHHAAPENVQQVFVEMPESHLPNIGQIFPGKWPENLVAAFVPADWLADHVEINQDDDDDDYEYYTDTEDDESDPIDPAEVEEDDEDDQIVTEDQYDEY